MSKKANRSVARRRVRRTAVAMAPTTVVGGLTLAAGASPAGALPVVLHASPAGGDTGCTTSSPCNLQAALNVASEEAPATIDLAQGTYTGPFEIESDVNLVGVSQSTTILEGGDPVVTVDSEAVANITNLTIEGGSDDGESFFGFAAGILNHGTLTLNRVTVTGNTETGGGAAAIDNENYLNIINSVFSRNLLTSGIAGTPGIFNDFGALLTINGSTFTDNLDLGLSHCFDEPFCADGGGIANVGALAVYQTTFTANTAYKGGAIANAGDAYLSGVTAQYNEAFKGGAIYNFGDVSIPEGPLHHASSTKNPSEGLSFGTLNIVNGTISNNNSFKGGGIYNDIDGYFTMTGSGGVDGNAAFVAGGGIYNAFGCQYEDDGVGEGVNNQPDEFCLENDGFMNLTGTTIQSNVVSETTAGGANLKAALTKSDAVKIANKRLELYFGSGGGIDNEGYATITNNHIDLNYAEYGGGIYNDSYPEDEVFASLTVTTSIINHNVVDNCEPSQTGCPS